MITILKRGEQWFLCSRERIDAKTIKKGNYILDFRNTSTGVLP
jgi:hypothetical protein